MFERVDEGLRRKMREATEKEATRGVALKNRLICSIRCVYGLYVAVKLEAAAVEALEAAEARADAAADGLARGQHDGLGTCSRRRVGDLGATYTRVASASKPRCVRARHHGLLRRLWASVRNQLYLCPMEGEGGRASRTGCRVTVPSSATFPSPVLGAASTAPSGLSGPSTRAEPSMPESRKSRGGPRRAPVRRRG